MICWSAARFSCIVLDQLTKHWAIATLKGQPTSHWLGDVFRLGYTENPGAFLSLGASLPEPLRTLLLSGAVGVFLIICTGYLLRSRNLERFSALALSLVVGGGFSNLLDRIFRTQGRVVDFMNLGVGELRTGVFNVADLAIVAGVVMLALEIFDSKSVVNHPQ